MATINLGNIKFNWKGTYNAGTAYAVDDVVSYNGSSYVCILASTGNLPTNTTYWNVMSSAGTNGTDGTDLTTTLTTQGDILYRDGSGLQRLGAGTNGQALLTGGTGANPSWGTVSSDYVLLSSPSDSSATTHNFSDVFTDTYKTFRATFSQWCAGANPRMRFLTTGTNQLSATSYDWSGNESGLDTSSSQYENQNYGRNDSKINIHSDGAGDTSLKRHYFDIHFYNMRQSSHYPHIIWNHFGYSGSDWLEGGTKGARYRNTQTIGGFHLLNSTGSTQYIYDMKIYGIK